MGQRLDWWRPGLASIVAGVGLMAVWGFLLEDKVFNWLGIDGHGESFNEKVAHVAVWTMATALIVAGAIALVRSRIAAERGLRQGEELFRLVFQESPGMFAMTRASDGLHYDVNEQWVRVLGYPRADVIGRTATEIGVWADAGERHRLMDALAKSASVRNFEVRLKAKDGRIIPALAAVEKVTVVGEERILIVSQEITELKKVESALRASERQLRAIFDNMQDAYYRTDGEGRLVMTSAASEQLLGYSREEIIGKRLADYYWDPQDRDRLLQALAESDGRLAGVESKMRHRDGRPVWVWTKLQYWHDDTGYVGGIEGIARDITDKKKAEEELQATRDELELRVQERTRDLKEALEKVSEASRAKSDFLANMSHELRTPMNAILGFSDMLAKEALGPMGNPRYRDYAGDIYQSGQHLLSLINELLDLARIEARTLELRDDTVDIGALIRSVIHMCEKVAEKEKVSMRIAAAVSVPRLRGDELRLTQVFLNLIGNALKFTPVGGRVDIRYGLAVDGGIEAVVADTGQGIAPEDIERVQTPFARGRQPFVRSKEGLGLGLPLAKAFVEAHGGTLTIASTPGKGTTVVLGFPKERVIVQN